MASKYSAIQDSVAYEDQITLPPSLRPRVRARKDVRVATRKRIDDAIHLVQFKGITALKEELFARELEEALRTKGLQKLGLPLDDSDCDSETDPEPGDDMISEDETETDTDGGTTEDDDDDN